MKKIIFIIFILITNSCDSPSTNERSYYDYVNSAISNYNTLTSSSLNSEKILIDEIIFDLTQALQLKPDGIEALFLKYHLLDDPSDEKLNLLDTYAESLKKIKTFDLPVTVYVWKYQSGGYYKEIIGDENNYEEVHIDDGELVGSWEERSISGYINKKDLLSAIVTNSSGGPGNIFCIKLKDETKKNDMIILCNDYGEHSFDQITMSDKNKFRKSFGNSSFKNIMYDPEKHKIFIDSIFTPTIYQPISYDEMGFFIKPETIHSLSMYDFQYLDEKFNLMMDLAILKGENCDLQDALNRLTKTIEKFPNRYEPYFATGLLREGRNFNIKKSKLTYYSDDNDKTECLDHQNLFSYENAIENYNQANKLYADKSKKYDNFVDLYNSKMSIRIPSTVKWMKSENNSVSQEELISISDIEISWSECYFEGKNYIERVPGYIVMDHEILDDGIIYHYVTGVYRDDSELKQGKLQFTQDCKVKGT